MTLEKTTHLQDEQAGTQQLQCTWWQSSAEPSPVHHAEDFLHALKLPASAHACCQMLRIKAPSSLDCQQQLWSAWLSCCSTQGTSAAFICWMCASTRELALQ